MARAVCDATFADLIHGPRRELPVRDAGTVAILSLVLPGAGHAYLGLWAEGVARAVLSIWAVTAFLAFALAGPRVLVAGFFGTVSLLLWAVSAHDAYRQARGEAASVILAGRAFLWVVLGLFVGLIAALLLGA